ncbi:hypothetical protein HAX54_004978, partial [Datura stramonium]|nr:hypothetical protein [Datura stramonium]
AKVLLSYQPKSRYSAYFVMCRAIEANEVKGYGWLIIMMAAYFFYLVLKFNVMIWSFGFLP